MRFYSGKVFQQGLNRRFRQHAESRDAIVWDIDTENLLVRCKIQGSDEYILCHYPRNSTTLPGWCKRGNAVRIAHKGGVRGFLEVISNGRAIPTPVSGNTLPDQLDRPDEIVTGGGVTPYSGMTVKVDATTYRISNVVYTLSIEGVPMADPPFITMGDGTVMGADGAYLTFDAAPAAPNARYDLIVAGTDGLAHIVKGTASENPSMPSVPTDHVKIAHVLILGGMTEILAWHIGAAFETRILNSITWALSSGTGTINGDGEFEWHSSNNYPYCAATFTMRCQYGWALSGSYTLEATMLSGSGDWSLDHSTWTTDDLSKSFTGSTAVIYYRRDQTVTEESPIIQATAEGTIISAVDKIQLLDALGDPI
jgi:hypothetical protein